MKDEMDFLDNLGGDEEELIGDDEMNEALDEFIDQNKGRFRGLYHKFQHAMADDEPPPELLPANLLLATDA